LWQTIKKKKIVRKKQHAKMILSEGGRYLELAARWWGGRCEPLARLVNQTPSWRATAYHYATVENPWAGVSATPWVQMSCTNFWYIHLTT